MTIQEDLTPFIYRHVLLIHIHYIHALIGDNPSQTNVVGNYDITSSYIRDTVWGCLASMCMTIVQGIAPLSFRLTFWGSILSVHMVRYNCF